MRVGLVCPYDMGSPGGVQDQVLRLSRWLRHSGHEVSLVAPGDCEQPGFVSMGPTSIVSANGAATPVALSPRVIGMVIDALADVDVAHIHEPLMPQVSLAALRRAPVPLVGTFHADVSRLASGIYRFGKPLIAKWFRRLDVITAVSPIAARVVADTGRVRIIPNGIDIDEYAPTDKTPNSVAFLGRDDERKGLAVLLEAWPQIYAAHPDAELTVIGAEALGRQLPGVQFLGRVSEEDKRNHLKQVAIFCAPNLSGESFGIVVVEAMAAACAVVATGLPAFVHVAGDAARFVGRGDSDGVAHEVISLLSDPVAASQLGQAAATSSHRFGSKVVAGSYIDAYEAAVAGASN